jgi:ABC-type uncharacterized transport system permease subunit
MFTLALLTALGYAGLAVFLGNRLKNGQAATHRWLLLAILPALLHAYLLHLAIDTPNGQNLSLINIAGMVSWIIVLLLLIPAQTLASPLAIFALPVAAVLVVLQPQFPTSHVLQLKGHWPSLLHIFSALLAYSLLLVAAVQALLLWFFERQLRSQPTSLSVLLPPLTLQETFLFRVISTGFGLLTLSLVVAALTLSDLFASQPLHKFVFSVLSWITFAVLLIGRIKQGWRGRQAIRLTLFGFAFLAVGYVGSRAVIEYILQR